MMPVNVVMPGHESGIALDNLSMQYGNIPYVQLSMILVHLRYVSMLHQTAHWTAKGDPFYGDHNLFERLYNATLHEIDKVAEKAVGLGTAANVDLRVQLAQLSQLASEHQTATLPQRSDLAKKSLAAEVAFLTCLSTMLQQMRDQRCVTDGIENMLQGIADVHEGHVYLLKQRCAE